MTIAFVILVGGIVGIRPVNVEANVGAERWDEGLYMTAPSDVPIGLDTKGALVVPTEEPRRDRWLFRLRALSIEFRSLNKRIAASFSICLRDNSATQLMARFKVLIFEVRSSP